MGTLSERGTLEPSRSVVIFWGVATGAVAAVMLLVGGDSALTGLQNITIVAALPFALVMIGIAWALVKDLRNDPMMVRRRYAAQAIERRRRRRRHPARRRLRAGRRADPRHERRTGPLTHHPVGSGRPSWKPAADWMPINARSCSSATLRAPAYVAAERTPAQIWSIRSSTPGRSGSRYIREDEMPSS